MHVLQTTTKFAHAGSRIHAFASPDLRNLTVSNTAPKPHQVYTVETVFCSFEFPRLKRNTNVFALQ